ncbi:CSC1-like protein At4g35870 [Zingiber officinale]|nr:CSC1-like protein At4g35870 [Zingiber officinale]
MSLLSIPPSMAAQSPSPDPDFPFRAWYGNIQYLLNISAAGAASCVLLFLLVKLRYDHRRFPGPSALAAKLLAVYHATPAQIALHCGADAAQFLIVERASFFVLLAVSLIALFASFPLNLSGSVPLADPFARTTISHIHDGSPILWLHFLLAAIIVAVSHLGISRMEDDLRITRFRDGNGNPSDPNSSSIAIFTMMVQGIPRSLASNKAPLEEYLQHRYPGKVYRVVVPFDLCTLEYLTSRWTKLQNEISWLEARMDSQSMLNEEDNDDHESSQIYEHPLLRKAKEMWATLAVKLGFTEEERLRKLHNLKLVLQNKLLDYKEGRAQGSGIAFVVFKDVYTANKAVRDLRSERSRRSIGQFVSVMELQLGQSRWRVERAPPAVDIYWNHLGLSKLSLRLRKVAVNTCLLLMLLFFSSPLAVINAMSSAARIINAEAVDHAHTWLTWLEGSSWFGALILQFLPNVLIFVSLYIVIPSALSYLSKFECHLTVSGEQRSAMLKMVCFFLVNLILLRAMVESSLENAILRMGRCYLDGEDCKQIEQYISASFLSRSCLDTLAFLITSTFLGISFDLLAPVPWMKNILKKFRKNDMVQLVPEQIVENTVEQNDEVGNLRMPLVSEREGSLDLHDLEVHDLSEYPINRSFHTPKQTFDFAQYYAFNLTIFALTMIYSLFAPLVVPVGAIYFGYRYMVDKYNFLFVYRARGFPAGNDGKLMDRVLCIMHFCVVLFLLSMLFFFSVRGDSTKLQAILTLGLLFVYKMLPSRSDAGRPSLLEGIQTVDSFVDGPTDYEVFSNTDFNWDIYESQS